MVRALLAGLVPARRRRTGPEWAETVPSQQPPPRRSPLQAAERAPRSLSPVQALTVSLDMVAQSRQSLRHLHIVEQTLSLYPDAGMALISQSVLEKAARQLRLLMSHSRFRDATARRPDVRGLTQLRDVLAKRLMDLHLAAQLSATGEGAKSEASTGFGAWPATMPLDLELPLARTDARARAWPKTRTDGGHHA
ncbi:MAG: hypothetical protein HZA63_14075 [Rhodocyclales bacterium]|nr:hypothetical protein [Rhodocyclales bacterium]